MMANKVYCLDCKHYKGNKSMLVFSLILLWASYIIFGFIFHNLIYIVLGVLFAMLLTGLGFNEYEYSKDCSKQIEEEFNYDSYKEKDRVLRVLHSWELNRDNDCKYYLAKEKGG
jgi:hypothetical protein